MDKPEDRRNRGLRPLDELDPNGRATVISVFERDRQLLEFLDGLGIQPGAEVEFVSRNYDQTVTLRIAGELLHLGQAAAGKVWVQPERRAGAGFNRSGLY
jgi:DtxR family Mn-dependent transcriptional regulator